MKTDILRNLYYVLAAGWRQRYTIAMCALIMPLIATAVGFLAKRQFSSYTTILVQEGAKINPFLKDYSVDTHLKDRMPGMNALLHSRHILGEVAKELNLNKEGKLHEDEVVKRLSQSLTVELIGADLIRISYRSHSSENVKEILDAVTRHFLERLLAPERSSIDGSESFLENQLEIQREALLSSEKRLADFKVKYSARLPDQYSYDVMKLRDAESTLNEKQIEIAGIDAKMKSLRDQLIKNDPRVASIEDEIVKSSSELSLLRSRYTENHSRVVAAMRVVERLQAERDEILRSSNQNTPEDIEKMWQITSGASSTNTEDSTKKPLLVSQLETIEKTRSKQKQLKKEASELEKIIGVMSRKLSKFAAVEQQMAELTRDTTTRQRVYDDLLKRYEMAKVTGALGRFEESDRAKIIDYPYTPTQPDNLPWIVFTFAGLIGGILLGFAAALIVEIADTTVVRTELAAQIMGVPVLARLPSISNATPVIKHESIIIEGARI